MVTSACLNIFAQQCSRAASFTKRHQTEQLDLGLTHLRYDQESTAQASKGSLKESNIEKQKEQPA
jgi:hypothetical protein